MLRGVKKQIIEVVNTENEYFEKALLIVSDKYFDCDKIKLNRKAKKYIDGLNPVYNLKIESDKLPKDRVRIFISLLKFVGTLAAGILIAYFVLR